MQLLIGYFVSRHSLNSLFQRVQPFNKIFQTEIDIRIRRYTEFKEIKSIILGTYIDAGDYVYVNSKLIELENSINQT